MSYPKHVPLEWKMQSVADAIQIVNELAENNHDLDSVHQSHAQKKYKYWMSMMNREEQTLATLTYGSGPT